MDRTAHCNQIRKSSHNTFVRGAGARHPCKFQLVARFPKSFNKQLRLHHRTRELRSLIIITNKWSPLDYAYGCVTHGSRTTGLKYPNWLKPCGIIGKIPVKRKAKSNIFAVLKISCLLLTTSIYPVMTKLEQEK